MRVLVHICCGPCGITVLQGLVASGHQPEGFFFNPNIHPLAEYMRRRKGAGQVAKALGLRLLLADALDPDEQVWDDPWLHDARPVADEPCLALQQPAPRLAAMDPSPWLAAVSGRERGRCIFCWRSRLRKNAQMALARGHDGFRSKKTYSR